MNKWILLSIGGIAGTFLRYGVATWVPGIVGADFPFGTLVVNLTACLILGFLSGLSGRGALGAEGKLLLMTGFCGAYSTFSTWILESSNLASDGEMWRVLTNLLASVGAGFFLFRLGNYLGLAL